MSRHSHLVPPPPVPPPPTGERGDRILPQEPAIVEIAVPGSLSPGGGPALLPSRAGQSKDDRPRTLAAADTAAYVEADGVSRYGELPTERMHWRSHIAELDGGSAAARKRRSAARRET